MDKKIVGLAGTLLLGRGRLVNINCICYIYNTLIKKK